MQKCEIASKYILPFVRFFFADYLVNKMNLTQVEAAKKLKVTQAAISQYLRRKRGKGFSSIDPKIKKQLEAIAFEIASKDLEKNEIEKLICKACNLIYENFQI